MAAAKIGMLKEPVTVIAGRKMTRMGIVLPLDLARALRAEAMLRIRGGGWPPSTSRIVEEALRKELKTRAARKAE